jgi:hypothetical protein
MQLKLSQNLFKYEGVYFGNLMLVSIVNLSRNIFSSNPNQLCNKKDQLALDIQGSLRHPHMSWLVVFRILIAT